MKNQERITYQHAIKVLDGIFLGEFNILENDQFLEDNSIKNMIDCFYQEEIFKYPDTNHLSLPYDYQVKLQFQNFDECFDLKQLQNFIDEALDRGESVLIHSKLQYSQSCAVLACYLMNKFRWNLKKVLDFLFEIVRKFSKQSKIIQSLIKIENRLLQEGVLSQHFNEKVQDPLENVLQNTYQNLIEFKQNIKLGVDLYQQTQKNPEKVKYDLEQKLWFPQNLDLKKIKPILKQNVNETRSNKKKRRMRRSISVQGSTIKRSVRNRRSIIRERDSVTHFQDESFNDMVKNSKALFEDCDKKIIKNDDYIQFLQHYREVRKKDTLSPKVSSFHSKKKSNELIHIKKIQSKSPIRQNNLKQNIKKSFITPETKSFKSKLLQKKIHSLESIDQQIQPIQKQTFYSAFNHQPKIITNLQKKTRFLEQYVQNFGYKEDSIVQKPNLNFQKYIDTNKEIKHVISFKKIINRENDQIMNSFNINTFKQPGKSALSKIGSHFQKLIQQNTLKNIKSELNFVQKVQVTKSPYQLKPLHLRY